MSFKSHIPFHRQISGSLVFLFLLFIFIIGFTSFLLYQRNVQVNEWVNTQIPDLQFSYEYKKHIIEYDKLFVDLNNSRSETELKDNFFKIKKNLDGISALNAKNVEKISYLLDELNSVNGIVDRLIKNEPKDVSLKQASAAQLNELIETLKEHIETKKKDNVILYEKATSNGTNGYVQADLVVQYTRATKVVEEMNKALDFFNDASAGFDALSLKITEEQLDAITDDINAGMSFWLSTLTRSPKDKETRGKIELLKSVINIDKRALDKWFDHLSLSEEAYRKVEVIDSTLKDISLSSNNQVDFISFDNVVPNLLIQLTKDTDYKISVQDYYYGLIGLLVLSLLIVFGILFRLRYEIQRYSENTVSLCQTLLSDEKNKLEQDNYVNTAEQLSILSLIKRVQKPGNGKYESMLNLYYRDLTFIQNNHNTVIWEYRPLFTYIDVSDFVSNLAPELKIKTKIWRHLFSKKSVKTLIDCAKAARDTDGIQSCTVGIRNGTYLNVMMGHDGVSWFGTLSYNEKEEILKSTVTKFKNKHQELENYALEELSATTDSFNQMVLASMVQSQVNERHEQSNTFPVYQQLVGMHDWCNQTNLLTQLQNNLITPELANVHLIDELHAVVFNVISENKSQNNKIYLKTDEQLLNFVSIDPLLFNRLLTGLFRVVINQLSHAKVIVDFQVINSESDNQSVNMIMMVSTAKRLHEIPDMVNRLTNDNNDVGSSTDTIAYLKSLMDCFNIESVSTELYEDGYSLSVPMDFSPLAYTEDLLTLEDRSYSDVQNLNLKDAAIVSVGLCPLSQTIISDNVSALGGSLKSVGTAEQLKADFDVYIVELNPIDVIIIDDETADTSLADVKAYIQSMPKNQQPKLFVMQSLTHPLTEQGLYSQAAMPLCQNSFQHELCQILNNDELEDNLLIEEHDLIQYQFLSTQTEVLLAVNSPQKHQTLIRILEWLGLQVHVVSQSSMMLQAWQSGRYLLLMSEFDDSPYIELLVGENIPRGIFTLKDKVFDSPKGNIIDMTKHWTFTKLPKVDDIEALVTSIKPWLKPKTIYTTQAQSTSKRSGSSKNKKYLSSVSQKQNQDSEFDEDLYLSNASLLDYDETADVSPSVINMEAFAANQGSAELAFYMLDEYVQDIEDAVSVIDEAIAEKSPQEMELPLMKILKLSDVMATSELKASAEQLQSVLANNSNEEENFEAHENVLALMIDNTSALRAYANAT